MKTVFLIAFSMLVAIPARASFNDQFRNQDQYGTATKEIPSKMQVRLDYSGTTSGFPIYRGTAAPGTATDSANWRVCKTTDSASGPTLFQCADNVTWDDRASATYE